MTTATPARPAATFTRIGKFWGAKVPGAAYQGARIEITRRDNTTTPAIITLVTGMDAAGRAICQIDTKIGAETLSAGEILEAMSDGMTCHDKFLMFFAYRWAKILPAGIDAAREYCEQWLEKHWEKHAGLECDGALGMSTESAKFLHEYERVQALAIGLKYYAADRAAAAGL